MVNIKLIIGSTRPTRFGTQPAHWIAELAQKRTDATFELIDLADVKLPFLDEPKSASMVSNYEYEHEHTRQWSERIRQADGFVFVTPEYNHGYSPALKNAIDYLYSEWHHKPASFVSYGAHAGGARAVEQLRGVAGQIKVYDLSEHVIIPSYYAHMDEAGKWQPTDEQVTQAQHMLDALVFWAEQMKSSRAKLAEKSAT